MGREWHRVHPMIVLGTRRATGDGETAKDAVREKSLVAQVSTVSSAAYWLGNFLFRVLYV